MNSIRKSPLFIAALMVCAAIAAAELWYIFDRWSASRSAAAKLVQRQQELEAMRDVLPPPKRDIATAIEADLERAQRVLGGMKHDLEGRGPTAERIRNARPPAARTDAYFDLATFVERMRQLARSNGVELSPEAARFGFSEYANEAPETERIESVFEQRLIAQYLLEALLTARPQALLAVKREPPLTREEREARDAPPAEPAEGEDVAEQEEQMEDRWSGEAEGPDYFVVDPRVTVAARGYVNTTAFRLVFTGQTAALRQFLNRLATFDVPVLVREVEVEIATAEELSAGVEEAAAANEASPAGASMVLSLDEPAPETTASRAADAATPRKAAARPPHIIPIVSRTLSTFTVTVEYVRLVEPQPAAEEAVEDGTMPNV
jgi:hypothetical protein